MWIQLLEDFIENTQNKLEITRATAVKMVLCGHRHQEIIPVLGISSGFISKWKKAFFQNGVDGLKLAYKGSKGFLDSQEHSEIVNWLHSKDRWTFNELEYHIASKYGVAFESKQSYYDLFHEARISWKKTQAKNPKYDSDKVTSKKKRLVNCWRREEPKSSQES
ncbi:transposase [Rivularia sp. PCC 7116]|nr:transposase [Rivularia sp. PCC 7116]